MYTENNLRQLVALKNKQLAYSGSNWFFQVQGRNGYQAIDLYFIDEDGSDKCMRNLCGGTNRECAQSVESEFNNIYGKVALSHVGAKITRECSFEILKMYINFNDNFCRLDSISIDMLAIFAKITKYRKPMNSNGSTARYFYAHLQRKFLR